MSQQKREVLDQLRQMDEYRFEQLVSDSWEAEGWDTTVTRGSNDRGVDVVAKKDSPFERKMVIQAKRYNKSNKVGGPEVREYASLKQQESNVDVVLIVTTSSFTGQANHIANDLNVKLMNGNMFADTIIDNKVYKSYQELNNIDTKKTDGQKTKERATSKNSLTDLDVNPEKPPRNSKFVEGLNAISPFVGTETHQIKNYVRGNTEYLEHQGFGVISAHELMEHIRTTNRTVAINTKKNFIPPHEWYKNVFLSTRDSLIIVIGRKRFAKDDVVIKTPKNNIKSVQEHVGIFRKRFEIELSNHLTTKCVDEEIHTIHLWNLGNNCGREDNSEPFIETLTN